MHVTATTSSQHLPALLFVSPWYLDLVAATLARHRCALFALHSMMQQPLNVSCLAPFIKDHAWHVQHLQRHGVPCSAEACCHEEKLTLDVKVSTVTSQARHDPVFPLH
jgi:hypothetical protein